LLLNAASRGTLIAPARWVIVCFEPSGADTEAPLIVGHQQRLRHGAEVQRAHALDSHPQQANALQQR
jgi:hypothetical protein